MALTIIEQKVKYGEESICKTCAHNKVCRYMDNQPCIECSQYAAQERHGRWEWRGGIPWCINCGEMPPGYSYEGEVNTTPYCPNCIKKDGEWFCTLAQKPYYAVQKCPKYALWKMVKEG